MSRQIGIAPWPEDDGNPYQSLFYGALEPFGIRRVRGLVINDQYLRDHANDIDAIHLHWPEYAWRVHGSRLDRQARLLVGFSRFLKLSSRLGIARIWTAHNVRPHEVYSPLDHVGYYLVARNADLIIAHGADARREVLSRYRPRCPVVTMPQGNYAAAYPAPREAAIVRAESGWRADVPLLVCVGALRPYKGFELAIEAVGRLGGQVQLVIAGSAKEQPYVEQLRRMATSAGSVVILDRTLTDQEFADLISASDAVLLPYARITTSAVLLAAWTFGRGVVATPLPYFDEFVRPRPAAGCVSEAWSAAAFAAAIQRYLSMDASVRTSAARQAAAEFTWERAATLVTDAIRQAVVKRGDLART